MVTDNEKLISYIIVMIEPRYHEANDGKDRAYDKKGSFQINAESLPNRVLDNKVSLDQERRS